MGAWHSSPYRGKSHQAFAVFWAAASPKAGRVCARGNGPLDVCVLVRRLCARRAPVTRAGQVADQVGDDASRFAGAAKISARDAGRTRPLPAVWFQVGQETSVPHGDLQTRVVPGGERS